jgi:hypothetical protein
MCCGRNIVKGAAGLVRAAVANTTGIGLAGVAELERRREICRTCDDAIPCKANPLRKCWCKRCGCLLTAKTSLKSERCPAGKW